MSDTAILLLHCPDQKGIVAALADFVFRHGGNILSCDQYQDPEYGLFFMRMQWSFDDFDLTREQFSTAFAPPTEKFQLQWKIAYSKVRERIAIFVSHHQYCLVDLYGHQIGELTCDIPLIISNHPDAEATAKHYGIPFAYIPSSNNPLPALSIATSPKTSSKRVAIRNESFYRVPFVGISNPAFCAVPEEPFSLNNTLDTSRPTTPHCSNSASAIACFMELPIA